MKSRVHMWRQAWVWSIGLVMLAPAAYAEESAVLLEAAGRGVVLVLAGDNAETGSSSAGFVVSPEGKILTLAQTVHNPMTQKPYQRIFVYLRPSELSGQAGSSLMNRFRAQVIASSPAQALDLALLQLEDAPAEMTPLTFGNANQMASGSEALAVGHAEAAGLWSGQRVHVVSRVENYGRAAGRQCWVLDRGVGFGQWGGPLLDAEGHVQGMVMAPLVSPKGAHAQGGHKPVAAAALTSTALVGWLAQNNMALAAPGSPPGDDPDSASDNPTPQPSTVEVVGAAPDAEAARRRAMAAAHGSSEPKTLAGPAPRKASLGGSAARGADSFVTARRPYSLRQILRQQLRVPMGTAASPAAAPQTAGEKAADKER